MKDVVFLSVKPEVPPDSYWDMTLLKNLLSSCQFNYEVGDLKEAIVIIPGSNQGDKVDLINLELSKLEKCKVIVTSDESNHFPIDSLSHPNMEVYANYPNKKYTSDITWLPIGTPRSRAINIIEKDLPFFFSGQVTHKDRRDCAKVLRSMEGMLVETKGFAQGLSPEDYYYNLDAAKFAPCPNGTVSPDSFRLYEALEAGCIPIVKNNDGFWYDLFDDIPFPIVEGWEEMKGLVYSDELALECATWWERQKQDIKYKLLGKPDITVVVPASPIKSHPSTEVILETLSSVHSHLPNAQFIVTFDGVRVEQADKKHDYYTFVRRLIRDGGVYPFFFRDHSHQVAMMRHILDYCSEYVVYVEQDTPLTLDIIDWEGCKLALSNQLDLIRFHFEADIPEPHKYLMIGEPEYNSGISVQKTKQWSQRPHITTREFYRKVLNNFSEDAKSFIEDKMHSVAQEFPKEYRLAIYHPLGSIKRSYHLDGRAGEEKYDEQQVF